MMKTLGRMLIITAIFVLFASLMVAAVDVIGMNLPDFDGNRRTEFRPPSGEENRPPPSDGEGREERGGDFRLVRLILGMGKNTMVIAILVAAIVWPRSILRKRRRAVV
jgi:hypothetical protein